MSTGLALVAVGATNATRAGVSPADAARAQTLSRVGAGLLVFGWVLLVVLAALATAHDRADTGSRPARRLLLAVLAALPFVGVRAVVTLVFLVTGKENLSAVTGELGVRVGLYLLMETLAALILIIGGLVSMNIGPTQRRRRQGPRAARRGK